MAEGGENWCLIESDPGVFTELLEKLGCNVVEFQELWSLDDLSFKSETNAVYGLIFLFQYKKELQQNRETVDPQSIPQLFFAQQVTTNACATQAILSVLFNTIGTQPGEPDKLTAEQLGKVLAEFREFTADFPPNLKGVAISGSEEIRAAHNSFAREPSFLPDEPKESSSGEAFHFVGYVPHQGKVYELDGLQEGPIEVGNYETDWLDVASTAIQTRMQAFGSNAVKFNLMAVIQDKRLKLQAQLAESPDNDALLAQQLAETQKREQWQRENERRRHNYLPLVVASLQELARLGKLEGLMEHAKEVQQARVRAAMGKEAVKSE